MNNSAPVRYPPADCFIYDEALVPIPPMVAFYALQSYYSATMRYNYTLEGVRKDVRYPYALKSKGVAPGFMKFHFLLRSSGLNFQSEPMAFASLCDGKDSVFLLAAKNLVYPSVPRTLSVGIECDDPRDIVGYDLSSDLMYHYVLFDPAGDEDAAHNTPQARNNIAVCAANYAFGLLTPLSPVLIRALRDMKWQRFAIKLRIHCDSALFNYIVDACSVYYLHSIFLNPIVNKPEFYIVLEAREPRPNEREWLCGVLWTAIRVRLTTLGLYNCSLTSASLKEGLQCAGYEFKHQTGGSYSV